MKPNRKKQIKQVAQNMFRERGYAATSMRDLANEVGIEAASLYNHIKSKEDLLLQICEDKASRFFAAMDTVKAMDLPPDQKLVMAIKSHTQIVTEDLDGAGVFLHEWRFLKGAGLAKIKGIRKIYRQEFQAIIQDGVAQGYYKNINAKMYSITLLSALNWIYDWYKPEGDLSPEALGKQFAFILLEGIRK